MPSPTHPRDSLLEGPDGSRAQPLRGMGLYPEREPGGVRSSTRSCVGGFDWSPFVIHNPESMFSPGGWSFILFGLRSGWGVRGIPKGVRKRDTFGVERAGARCTQTAYIPSPDLRALYVLPVLWSFHFSFFVFFLRGHPQSLSRTHVRLARAWSERWEPPMLFNAPPNDVWKSGLGIDQGFVGIWFERFVPKVYRMIDTSVGLTRLLLLLLLFLILALYSKTSMGARGHKSAGAITRSEKTQAENEGYAKTEKVHLLSANVDVCPTESRVRPQSPFDF